MLEINALPRSVMIVLGAAGGDELFADRVRQVEYSDDNGDDRSRNDLWLARMAREYAKERECGESGSASAVGAGVVSLQP